jgi:hypothetical protein
MAERAVLGGHCERARRAPVPPAARSAWQALPAIAFAALVPKCPLCLCGLLALVGATGAERVLLAYIDARMLCASMLAALAGTAWWLTLRRGAAAGVISALAAGLVLCGKFCACAALVGCGGALLVGYILLEPKLSGILRKKSS